MGPLPCFPSLQFTITQSRATGIADHILPLGDLLLLLLSSLLLLSVCLCIFASYLYIIRVVIVMPLISQSISRSATPCIFKSSFRSPASAQTDGRTKVPVFYRTSSPSGPLPCFPSLQFTITQSRATGIADHILPLGNLFSFILSQAQSVPLISVISPTLTCLNIQWCGSQGPPWTPGEVSRQFRCLLGSGSKGDEAL